MTRISCYVAISKHPNASPSLTSGCPDIENTLVDEDMQNNEHSPLLRTSLHIRVVSQLRLACYDQLEVFTIVLTSTAFHPNVYQ